MSCVEILANEARGGMMRKTASGIVLLTAAMASAATALLILAA